jgi:hypothetical protein
MPSGVKMRSRANAASGCPAARWTMTDARK